MVPSGDLIKDIRVRPFFLLKVKDKNIGVLHLRVPSSIDVDFSVTGEHTVSTSSIRNVSGEGFDLLPSLGLEIEGVKVVEGNSGVVETSVTSEQVNLSVVEGGSRVGSGSRGSDGRVKVFGIIFIVSNSLPSDFSLVDGDVPAVVKSGLGTVVTTENEDLIFLGGGDGDVLGSRKGNITSMWGLLGPGAIIYNNIISMKINLKWSPNSKSVTPNIKEALMNWLLFNCGLYKTCQFEWITYLLQVSSCTPLLRGRSFRSWHPGYLHKGCNRSFLPK